MRPAHGVAAALAFAATAATVATLGCAAGQKDLSGARAIGRDALAYHATMVGTRLLVTVELALRFELVVRRLDGAAFRELGRLDLGPPDWDVTGLASAATGPLVWLSSRDGTVRSIDVGAMSAARTWPIGVATTSIATDRNGTWVAYGTANGIICLRRAADGALLQCVQHGEDEISALVIEGEVLVSGTSGGQVTRWGLPTLMVNSSVEVGGPVGALAASAGGLLAIAIGGRPGRPDPQSEGRGQVLLLDRSGRTRPCGVPIPEPTSAVLWLPAGSGRSRLLSATTDGRVQVWEVERDERGHGGWKCSKASSRSFAQPVSFLLEISSRLVAVGLWATRPGLRSAVLLDYLSEAP